MSSWNWKVKCPSPPSKAGRRFLTHTSSSCSALSDVGLLHPSDLSPSNPTTRTAHTQGKPESGAAIMGTLSHLFPSSSSIQTGG